MLEALKEAGLPATYITLLKFEKAGVIRSPNKNANGNRIYTDDEIAENVKAIKIYKHKYVLSKKKK